MTWPVDIWHSARSVSDSAFDREVKQSASKKSANVTSLNGVHTRQNVHVKKSLVSWISANNVRACKAILEEASEHSPLGQRLKVYA